MNKLKIITISVFALIGTAVLTPVYTTNVHADAAGSIKEGVNSIGGNEGDNDISLGSRIKTVTNVLLYVLGAIAVIMIIVGGIRYTTSNGDASSIKSAKDTILYAVVGVVVAILAYAIVNFAINSFS
jgi:multisubunit Na+/H+ antiporter MnhB subunit